MLGHWRIVLRQAEEAARAGRYDEALALASRPDVADHHHAVQLRGRLALDLIARAGRRGEADDLAGAIDDLDLAERLGAAARRPGRGPAAAWPTGSPTRSAPTSTPASRPGSSSGSRSWPGTRSAARRCGGPARSPRPGRRPSTRPAAASSAGPTSSSTAPSGSPRAPRTAALAAARRDVEARQKAAAPKVEALYAALAKGQWAEILAAAEAVLEVVPEHPAARQARTRAWQQIAAIGPSAATLPEPGRAGPPGGRPPRRRPPSRRDAGDATAGPVRSRPRSRRRSSGSARRPKPAAPGPDAPARWPAPGEPGPKGRFLLWVDAVGGYLVCLDDQIILGRAGPRQPGRRPPHGRPLPQPRDARPATATATSCGPTSRRSSTAGRSRPPRSATAT